MPAPWGIHEIIGKPLENIGILDDLIPVNPNGIEMVGEALGILGIPAGASAGAMGNSRNHWETIGKHLYLWMPCFP